MKKIKRVPVFLKHSVDLRFVINHNSYLHYFAFHSDCLGLAI